MDELTPPLNDEGMQVFCRWLHHTFQLMREQHQIRSMQMVPRLSNCTAWLKDGLKLGHFVG